jgi:hypothetical protein
VATNACGTAVGARVAAAPACAVPMTTECGTQMIPPLNACAQAGGLQVANAVSTGFHSQNLNPTAYVGGGLNGECGGNCAFDINPIAKNQFAYNKTPYFDDVNCATIENYSKGKLGNVLNPEQWVNGQGTQVYSPFMYTNLSQSSGLLPPVQDGTFLISFTPLNQITEISNSLLLSTASLGVEYGMLLNYIFGKSPAIVDAHSTYQFKVVFQNQNLLFENFNSDNNPGANRKYVAWLANTATSRRPISGMQYMRVGSSFRTVFESQYTNRIVFLNFGFFEDGDEGDECERRCPLQVCGLGSYFFVREHPVASGHKR